MRERRLAGFGLGLLLILCGCGSGPLTSAVVEVTDWKPLAVPVEILAGGTSLGTFSEKSFRFAIPPGTIGVTAHVVLPCTEKRLRVQFRIPNDQEVAQDKAAGLPPAKRGQVKLFVNELMGRCGWTTAKDSPARSNWGIWKSRFQPIARRSSKFPFLSATKERP